MDGSATVAFALPRPRQYLSPSPCDFFPTYCNSRTCIRFASWHEYSGQYLTQDTSKVFGGHIDGCGHLQQRKRGRYVRKVEGKASVR